MTYMTNMSRQRSLKQLFDSSRSVPDKQNDDGELLIEEEESDDNLEPDDLSRSMTNDGTATVQDQESSPSELEDETISITGTETDNEINEPNQPRHEKFPSKKFGKQQRCFNSKWFDNDKWSPWLHWDNGSQKAFCYICKNISQMQQLTSKNADDAFISAGFDNWKRATTAFEQHRLSKCYKESVLKWNHHLKGTSIQVQLNKQVSLEQKKNLHCLEIIFSSIEYLARQGLPLRGHEDERGNFTQLLKLRANDCKDLQVWMERKRAYLSHEIQNEILKMSHLIIWSILKDVSSSLWYSVMADEGIDASLTEQVCE